MTHTPAGGSNFGGLAFPILREKMAGKMAPAVIAVEPAACPSLTKGKYVYDYGDTAGESPVTLEVAMAGLQCGAP